MLTLRRGRRTYKRALNSIMPRTLEALEPRVLLSGNSYTIGVYSFTGGADGAAPFAGLAADTHGNLFGTTTTHGAGNLGTVLELPSGAGAVTTMYAFTGPPDGATPYGGLLVDPQGNLFGTTSAGGTFGNGTVFEIPTGSSVPTILHSFTGADGANPRANLMMDPSGNLFGTTVNGGALGSGTVFEIPHSGGFFTLHDFTGFADGGAPYGGLLRDAAGNLFGTTFSGGGGHNGTLFEIPHGGGFTTLLSFTGTANGAKPTGQLTLDNAGNIFGTTSAGGAHGNGTIFVIAASAGSLTTLYSFTGGVDGASPYAGLTLDSSGDLFGTTFRGGAYARGTVFEIPFGASTPQTLYSFTGGADGLNPYGPVTVTTQGNIFGTTTGGGAAGLGTLISLAPTATTQLAVAQQPSDVQAGSTMTPAVAINLETLGNAVNTHDDSSVTLSILTGPAGATLGGTTTVQAHNGVATFNNLRLNRAGTYTLAAADGTLNAVALGSFVVRAGPATHLAFDQQPTALVAGQTITPGVTVFVEDALGNVTTDNSMVTIKVASGSTASGLTGTLSVHAVDGVATFGDLSLTKTGTYTLSAASGILKGAKSANFVVTPDLATAQLAIARLPVSTNIVGKKLAPDLVVNVVDQFGNVITTDHSAATISIVSGPTTGTIIGTTTVSAKKGVVTFKKLTLPVAGSYSLQVVDASLADTTPVLVAQTITQGVTSISGLPTKTTRSFGQTITLTAKCKSTAPSAIPFTGIATLTDSAHHVLGTAALTTNGQAKFALTGVAPGTYLCTVSYPGDINHTPATSSTFTLQVNLDGTSTTLAASPRTLVFGQPLTLTATVKSSHAPAVARTGNIQFYDGLNALMTVPLNSSSLASFTFATSAVGKHTFKAVYLGDANFQPSTSSGVSVKVT